MNENSRKKWIKWMWIVVFTPFLALFLFIFCVGVFAEIPSFEELENPKSKLATELISEDGEVINTYHIENRSYVKFKDLSPNLVNAAVATGDI